MRVGAGAAVQLGRRRPPSFPENANARTRPRGGEPMFLNEKEIARRQTEIKAELTALNDAHPGDRFDDETRGTWNALNVEYERLETDGLEVRAKRRRLEAIGRDARHLEPVDMPEPRLNARFDYNESQHAALKAIDQLNNDGEIRESGILRLDEAVRSDRVGDQAAYIAAASSDEYRIAFTKVLQYGAARRHDADRQGTRRGPPHRGSITRAQSHRSRRRLRRADPARPDRDPDLDGRIQSAAADRTRRDGHLEPLEGRDEQRCHGRVRARRNRGVRRLAGTRQPRRQLGEGAAASYRFPSKSAPIGERCRPRLMRMFVDAKDLLESQKFITGLGHSSTEPEGLLVGGTAIVTTRQRQRRSGSATSTASRTRYRPAGSRAQAGSPRPPTRTRFVASSVPETRRSGRSSTTGRPPPSSASRCTSRRGMTTAASSGSSVITYGDVRPVAHRRPDRCPGRTRQPHLRHDGELPGRRQGAVLLVADVERRV